MSTKSTVVTDYLEEMERRKDPEELQTVSATTVTIRIENHIIYTIDKLAKQIGESRSGLVKRLVCLSAIEIADELGKWEEWNVEFANLGVKGGKKAVKEAA